MRSILIKLLCPRLYVENKILQILWFLLETFLSSLLTRPLLLTLIERQEDRIHLHRTYVPLLHQAPTSRNQPILQARRNDNRTSNLETRTYWSHRHSYV